jgi:sulfoxide reductase catalytic subunit YedY
VTGKHPFASKYKKFDAKDKTVRHNLFSKNSGSGFTHGLSHEITPVSVYNERREWLKLMATGAAGLSMATWASREAMAQGAGAVASRPGKLPPLTGAVSRVSGANTMEKITPYADASTYNNFYEFGTDKADPAKYAHTLQTKPWTVDVEGLIKKPGRFDLDDLLKLSPMEERIYRMRCVEGWSMVIPWVGYSLAELIKRVEPLGNAKFVEFYTQVDPKTMPGVRSRVLDWPYVEGLRLDEAMHPLTMLSFGMYGEVLPNQNGAPVRLVVPWKYGFKNAKSLVKIRFVEKQPVNSWGRSAPQEYGFYSNVNPSVDHPRWSQATERRIGEDGLFAKKRKTLMFNGYEAQVGQLYAGMDLSKLY